MKHYDCNMLVSMKPEINSPVFNWIGKRILIVEDDYASYLLLCDMLSCTKAYLIHAVSLQEAFEMISAQPEYDLLIINIAIPGNTNCKAIYRIRLFWPFIPIIAVAYRECRKLRKKCIPSGCDTVMGFDVDRNELMITVNELIQTLT